jgi:DNA mismatch repair protein MutL
LKSQTVEFGYILDIFTRFAIAFPGTSWELYHNNELIHKLDNAGNVQSRIAYFFGQNILNSLQSINMANDKAKLEGLISNKSYFVSHLNYVYFFINGRPIKDRFMLRAVQEGYKELLPPRRNPAVFLFLTIPPDEVDMNVHPAKLEVRIRNVWNIAQNISDTIRKSLGQHYDIPQKTDDIFEAKYTPATDNATKEKSLLGLWESYRKIGDSEKKEMLKSEVVEFFTQERTSPKEEQTKLDIIDRNFIKITQLNDTFILEEKSDGIAIIDQHALHERLLYYDIKQKFQKKEILSQKMLLPLTFDVSPQMAECLEELIPMLTELGFEIGLFGQKTYAIHAAPDFLNGKNPVSVIRAVVENTSSDKRRMGLLDSVLATLSCRAAVKAGDKLNDTEIGHILNLKNKYRDMSTCPHGRPTEYFISWDKLERFFDRK